MYKIINIKDGTEIGSTEAPRFIRKKSTGCYVQSDEQNAQGVAYNNIAYNLQGRNGIDAEDTVILIEYDAGAEADKTNANIAKIIENQERSETEMQLALVEMYEAMEVSKNG